IVVMISNIGCIGYNICQVFLYKAYLSKDIQDNYDSSFDDATDGVYHYDELSKSVLIFHHYMSFIILVYMRSTVVIAQTFNIEPEFEYDTEVNCTGIDKKAAFQCTTYLMAIDLSIYGFGDSDTIPICDSVVQFFNCVSAIHDVRCASPENYVDYRDSYRADYKWTDLWRNINLCRNSSTEDLAEIGCLFWRQLEYAQHCGIMELDNCEKKLESRISACVSDFQERQEIPLNHLPAFLGDFKAIPADPMTVSKNCQAIKKMRNCLGKNLTENCVDIAYNTRALSMPQVLGGGQDRLILSIVGEWNFCPNDQNGVTLEDTVCLVNTTKYMHTDYYLCENPDADRYLGYGTQRNMMACQVLAVAKRCGRKTSELLYQVYRSDIVSNYLDWPLLNQDFDFYMNYTCTCSKYRDFW
ncbi:hypothetical protein FO519_009829, partial [Halicephalobus sp. NKZ332]